VVPELLKPEAAIEIAERTAGLLLASSPQWQPALASRIWSAPMLVQRLDRNDDYFYIVPCHRDANITARLSVNAISGRFMEVTAIEVIGASLPPYVEPTLTTHFGSSFELPSVRERILRPGTVGRHPVLAWKPCRESFSPFVPFYLLTVGDRIVYWRVDGTPFDRLTEGFA
jgi:hypothetical protein